ncbi:hypothetical protein KSP40_PGU000749 [Platanthera guangdongensis]|uniref:WDR11 second beta-propeller domain-containing protein n=1 Tax=Platanthera guangdongensis TaxID=2320717 RepID=A0ABR2LI74_9ASPA
MSRKLFLISREVPFITRRPTALCAVWTSQNRQGYITLGYLFRDYLLSWILKSIVAYGQPSGIFFPLEFVSLPNHNKDKKQEPGFRREEYAQQLDEKESSTRSGNVGYHRRRQREDAVESSLPSGRLRKSTMGEEDAVEQQLRELEQKRPTTGSHDKKRDATVAPSGNGILRSLALPFTVMEWTLPTAPRPPSKKSSFSSKSPTTSTPNASINYSTNACLLIDIFVLFCFVEITSTDGSGDDLSESFAFALVNGALGVFEVHGRRVRDFRPKWPSSSFASSDGLVTAMAYRLPHVVMGDRLGNICWWDVSTGLSSSFNAHREGIRRIKFSPVVPGDRSRGRIAVLFYDNTFSILDLGKLDTVLGIVDENFMLEFASVKVGMNIACCCNDVKATSNSKDAFSKEIFRPMPLCLPVLLPMPHSLGSQRDLPSRSRRGNHHLITSTGVAASTLAIADDDSGLSRHRFVDPVGLDRSRVGLGHRSPATVFDLDNCNDGDLCILRCCFDPVAGLLSAVRMLPPRPTPGTSLSASNSLNNDDVHSLYHCFLLIDDWSVPDLSRFGPGFLLLLQVMPSADPSAADGAR